MKRFWDFGKGCDPAFFLPDGTVVDYLSLFRDVGVFQDRLTTKGLFGLMCTGDYRQYVAYIAALRAGCPVVMMSANQSAQDVSLTLSWRYDPSHDELTHNPAGDAVELHPDLAVLLSTSGSTGSAKWVRLSHANIAANAASIASYLDLTAQDCAPMALPFQYSYGMSVVNSHLAAGGALALVQGSVLEDRFWALFKKAGCTSLAGVPHSFDLLEKSGFATEQLSSLRYMTQAGGRLSPEQVTYWAKRGAAEGWDFVVMYGQTEAAPRISYLPAEKAIVASASIGVPIPGGTLEIRDETGRVLADGTEGELIYQGPNTMMGYAVTDADLAGEQGSDVLKTGDIARQRPDGMFEIVGRASRFVKLFGYRVGLDDVEGHLKAQGLNAVCVGLSDQMHVFVEPTDQGTSHLEELKTSLADWLDVPEHSFFVHTIEKIPRYENGKIAYPKVTELARDAVHSINVENTLTGAVPKVGRNGAQTVAGIFKKYFPNAQITPATTFDDLEGDSLNYLSVTLELESVLSPLPADWQKMTVTHLQQYKSQAGWYAMMDMPTFIRALAISLIVAGHFDLFNYGGGGAFSLLVIIGMSFGMFTLPNIIEQHSIRPVVSMVARVGVLMLGFTAFIYSATGYGEWPAFFFIGNWISPYIEGSFWFIDIYVQIFLVVIAVLAVPAVRRGLHRAPFQWAAAIAGLFVIIAGVSDQLFDTNHLFRRLPHLMAWMFVLGVAIAYAKTPPQKLIVTGILSAGVWQLGGGAFSIANFFLLAGLALIWIPVLPLPRVLLKPIRYIAGASLFIFMTHFKFMQLTAVVVESPAPALEWVVAMLGGIGIWLLYRPVDVWINRVLAKPDKTAVS